MTAIKIIIGLVLIAALIAYWFLSLLADGFSANFIRRDLASPKNEMLYITSKNWGVSGDHQLTIISTDSEREFEIDSSRQMIFKGLTPFFYKVSNDTLFLVLREQHEMPAQFKSNWIIIQQVVDNTTLMGLMQDIEWKKP